MRATAYKFRLSAEVQELKGANGHVTGVQLKTGEVLPADFVVVGGGVYNWRLTF